MAALCLFLCLPTTLRAEPEYLGTFTWPVRVHDAGGFSGLEVSDDGSRLTVISDRAMILSATIQRDGPHITAITPTPPRGLHDPDDAPLPLELSDSEGLAIAPDGTTYVSFEGEHRVWAYVGDGPARPLPPITGFSAPHPNAGPEALAIDARGRLYTLPERSGQLTRAFPVWRFDATWTQPFAIPRRGGFLPAGADFGPDGRLYLLERAFNGFAFSSRIRAFTLSDTAILSEDTFVQTRPGQFDNLEGLAVWRDDMGAIRLTLISDDNFNALQSTQVVEFRLTP